MKVVICDDSIEDLMKIDEALAKYNERNPGRDIQVEKYSDALQLYARIKEKELADLYILDMIMPEKTGIELGNKLRQCGSEKGIIYITTSDEFAMDAYDVHALRYLLKPLREDQLFEALDYAFSYSDVSNGARYLVRTRTGLVSVLHSRIEYIENASRTLAVHLVDGEVIRSIFIRGSFDQEISGLISDSNFMQIHKSFLVNKRYVRKLNGDSIIMECGDCVPISRKRAADVKKEYLVYISEQYR
ncbi:MAG: response regulator transcription factor [Eubacterium sp.]|mgnify:CR=1 FL=1|jgi:Response regulator of the LytR/AlgR family|nr:response regulator transcription factor [Eubacterium sp.]